MNTRLTPGAIMKHFGISHWHALAQTRLLLTLTITIFLPSAKWWHTESLAGEGEARENMIYESIA